MSCGKEALKWQGLDPYMLLNAQETTKTTINIYFIELLPVILVIGTICPSRICLRINDYM